MLTLYSTFRRFTNRVFDKIQRNAIESWLKLDPLPEIIILGNDPGTTEVCKEYGLKHVANVKQSKAGTPYLNHFIRKAEGHASHDLMLLCSGDIIVHQDTMEVAKKVPSLLDEFCVCARKMHVDILKDGSVDKIRWASWQAGDYWLHSKGIFRDMPNFLIGRHKCEKWMYRMLCNKNALVDATDALDVWHQQHPHEHKQGKRELQHNQDLFDKRYFDVDKWKDTQWYEYECLDIGINFANWILTKNHELKDNPTPEREGWKQ